MESVSDYTATIQDGEIEQQTEILQNGFNPEEDNCENCAQELIEKPQAATEESTSCPVTGKRAALLYPLKPFPLYCLFPRDVVKCQAKTKG